MEKPHFLLLISCFTLYEGENNGKSNYKKKVYNPEDIQAILGIGKNRVYDFLEDVYLNTHSFKVIKIGKLYKVPIKSFDSWLNEE